MYNEKIDVAEIMQQIKSEASRIAVAERLKESGILVSEQTCQEMLLEIEELTETIRFARNDLHDSRNVGGIIPSYTRFPAPIRQFFRFFSKGMRKGIQFVIQDQVDVNSQIDTILEAMEKKETLMLQLILQLNTAAAPDEQKTI
jgi:PHD/YefM family antitoxin component YafN of YafNO toxin-antitoxin module